MLSSSYGGLLQIKWYIYIPNQHLSRSMYLYVGAWKTAQEHVGICSSMMQDAEVRRSTQKCAGMCMGTQQHHFSCTH